VNKKGYLIDQLTGNVRSRYTFDVVFQYSELIGVGDEKIELPLPYRLERHNFNPHQIMGNFDYYDKSDKPRKGPLVYEPITYYWYYPYIYPYTNKLYVPTFVLPIQPRVVMDMHSLGYLYGIL
jgi:hypothetical protein